MNKNQQKNRMGTVIILLAAVCLNGYAQQDSTKVASNSKEEGNRNVMLNLLDFPSFSFHVLLEKSRYFCIFIFQICLYLCDREKVYGL